MVYLKKYRIQPFFIKAFHDQKLFLIVLLDYADYLFILFSTKLFFLSHLQQLISIYLYAICKDEVKSILKDLFPSDKSFFPQKLFLFLILADFYSNFYPINLSFF
jgi:hypothetical protein